MRKVRDMNTNERRWHEDITELRDRVWELVESDVKCNTHRTDIANSLLHDLNMLKDMNPYNTNELHSGHEQTILKNTGYRKPYDDKVTPLERETLRIQQEHMLTG